VLEANPGAQGILLDLPQVIANAGGVASERLRLQPGDFFNDTLPRADAYLLSNVIHNWADDRAVALLRMFAAPFRNPASCFCSRT
jgi:hypothetical protein